VLIHEEETIMMNGQKMIDGIEIMGHAGGEMYVLTGGKFLAELENRYPHAKQKNSFLPDSIKFHVV